MKKLMWFLLVLPAVSLFSQNPQWEAELSGAASFPRGEMKEFLDDDGFGIGLRLGYRLGHSPFVVGFDFHALRLESDGFDNIEFVDTIIPSATELKVNSDVLMGHFSLRIQPPVGHIRPYVEGLLGVKHFSTDLDWYYDDFDFDEPSESERVTDDTALSYGLGLGVSMELRRFGHGPGIALRAGCRYLAGEEARYVVNDSVDFDGVVVTFATVETKTDMLIADLGLTFRF